MQICPHSVYINKDDSSQLYSSLLLPTECEYISAVSRFSKKTISFFQDMIMF